MEEDEYDEYYDDLLNEKVGDVLKEEYDACTVPPKEVAAGQGEGEKARKEGANAKADRKEKEQKPFTCPPPSPFRCMMTVSTRTTGLTQVTLPYVARNFLNSVFHG